MPTLPLGPEGQREEDVKRARRDPRHRAKKLEDQINQWARRLWFKVVKWSRAKSGAAKQRNQNQTLFRKLTWQAKANPNGAE